MPRHCHGSVAVTKSGRPEPSSRVKLVRSSVRDGDPTQRAGRMGVNPQKPTEKIQIPSVTVPKFKAGKALKDALKGKA